MTVKTQMYVGITKDMKALGEFYREWTGYGYDMSHIQYDCHDIVAKIDGRMIGALQLRIVRDPLFNRAWGLIENVYVTPDARRLGTASQLMHAAEIQASVFGCEFIKLTSRKDEGKALYRALGYEEGSAFYKNVHRSF
ncbi:GNAT family N-acetyltransferase [Patescibacteria group bacterium]|nr:GNAT family N-acetyltransferase [Patescibacteria group bacterium]